MDRKGQCYKVMPETPLMCAPPSGRPHVVLLFSTSIESCIAQSKHAAQVFVLSLWHCACKVHTACLYKIAHPSCALVSDSGSMSGPPRLHCLSTTLLHPDFLQPKTDVTTAESVLPAALIALIVNWSCHVLQQSHQK